MRQKIKLLMCQFLYYTGLLHLMLWCFSKIRRNHSAVIINYHSFVVDANQAMETTPTVTHRISNFREELKFLKKHFDVVPLDAVVDKLKEKKVFQNPAVAITVDDGLKNNFDTLFPVLKDAGVPVTIFLATGMIGTDRRIWVDRLAEVILSTKAPVLALNGIFENEIFTFHGIEQRRSTYSKILNRLKDVDMQQRDVYLKQIERELGAPEAQDRVMLNWDEVRVMEKNNIYFGAHTVTHPILTNMPLEAAKKEIVDSKKKIEQELGIQVKHFAYPNGRPKDFNKELKQFCEEIGFESVCTCDYGNNIEAADVFALKRIGSEVPISLFAVNVFRAFLK